MGVAIMKRYRSVICFPCGTCTQDISIYRIDIPFIYPSMKPAHDCPCPLFKDMELENFAFQNEEEIDLYMEYLKTLEQLSEFNLTE